MHCFSDGVSPSQDGVQNYLILYKTTKSYQAFTKLIGISGVWSGGNNAFMNKIDLSSNVKPSNAYAVVLKDLYRTLK